MFASAPRQVSRRRLVQSAGAFAAVAGVNTRYSPAGYAAPARQETPRAGGTAIVALPNEVTNYDPFLAGSNHGYVTARGLYNTLTRLDETMTPQPELATDWSISEDQLQLTLNLRPGVTFHSGRAFTSADVVFSIGAAQNPDYASLNRGLVSPISVEAPDDLTVVLTTETPYPAIFDALDGTFIVDSETAVPRFPEVGVGTGPFVQGERIPGEYARFTRFDGYWDGPALLDGFEVRGIAESPALALALETRAVDIVWRISYRDFDRLATDPGYLTYPGADAAAFFDLTLNTTLPFFADKRARQAMNWAIDRDRFVSSVLLDIVTATSVPYPARSLAYDETQAATYRQDLDQAAALLAEAGFADGFAFTILTSTSTNPGLVELAQILQADLQTLGVTATIEDVETTVYNERFLAGDFELAAHTFGRANKDPATLFGGAVVWYTDPATNPTRFESPAYTELVTAGATTLDAEERREIYREVTDLILDESFTIPIAQQPRAWATQSDVSGFAYTLDNMPLWHQIWLNR